MSAVSVGRNPCNYDDVDVGTSAAPSRIVEYQLPFSYGSLITAASGSRRLTVAESTDFALNFGAHTEFRSDDQAVDHKGWSFSKQSSNSIRIPMDEIVSWANVSDLSRLDKDRIADLTAVTQTFTELASIISAHLKSSAELDEFIKGIFSSITPPEVKELLDVLYVDGNVESSSASLVTLVETLFAWIANKQYYFIDTIMRQVKISKVSVDALVGLLRVTTKSRAHIPHWPNFLSAVRAELSPRGYDPEDVLRGLL